MKEQVLERFVRALTRTQPHEPWNLRLCIAAAESLGMDGGAITIAVAPTGPELVCATDVFVEQLENTQIVLREGPSLEALDVGEPVYATAQESVHRWPALAEKLAEGIQTGVLMAVPMRPTEKVVGVLTLHSRRPVDPDPGTAQALADLVALSALSTLVDPAPWADDWSTRDQINQAVGMVVAQLRVKPADALAVLRAHAFARNTTVSDIAEQIRGRSIIFTSGNDSNPPLGDR